MAKRRSETKTVKKSTKKKEPEGQSLFELSAEGYRTMFKAGKKGYQALKKATGKEKP
jgi:hypothetical protein